MFVGPVMVKVGTILLGFATVATVQANQSWRKKMTKVEDKKYPQAVHFMAMEYSSYFLGGLDGIDRKRQDRLNAIEDKVREMGIEWNDWTELVMNHFNILEDK